MAATIIPARAITEYELVSDGDNAAETAYQRRLDAASDYASFIADQAALADEEWTECVRLHEAGRTFAGTAE